MLVEGASEHFNQAQLFTQSPEQGETPRPVQSQNMDIMTYSQLINGSILSIPKSWSQMSQQSTDDMLVAVYSFIKTYIGASGAGQGSIDNRIEQAMDLVKSHLMSAVRSEVEELRDKISKLEDTVTVLSRENEVLRANVNQEVLAGLVGPRLGSNSITTTTSGGGGASDPAPHPALPPPGQH